jgi:hypothetical protein
MIQLKQMMYGWIGWLMVTGCTAPKYLPKVGDLDKNPFGSYIRIHSTGNKLIKGELIAVDSNQIIVLEGSDSIASGCVAVPIQRISRYDLRYAQPKHYGWSIPLSILLTLAHGYYAVFTLPASLAVTIPVTISGERAFQYNNNTLSYEQLKMFARFPQGLPPGVSLPAIK